MNTQIRTVSVHSQAFNRQANNLEVQCLSHAVGPWFADILDTRIAQAIDELDVPEQRFAAAEFLGLELIPVA